MLLDILEWISAGAAYSAVGGGTFRVLANHTADPDDPFKTGGPFFGGLFWFVGIPVAIAMKSTKHVGREGFSKIDRQRAKELETARHEEEMLSVAMRKEAILDAQLALSRRREDT
jgi:hypothetical protein